MIKRSIGSVFCCALLFNFLSCSKTDSTPDKPIQAVNKCSGTAGALFTLVKTLVQEKCVSCHNNSFASGGMNLLTDCSIITNQVRIKVRAVDQGNMPPGRPLSQTDKDKITAWINAGGAITN